MRDEFCRGSGHIDLIMTEILKPRPTYSWSETLTSRIAFRRNSGGYPSAQATGVAGTRIHEILQRKPQPTGTPQRI